MFILSLRPPFPEFRTACDANDRLGRNTHEHWKDPVKENTNQDVLETDETERMVTRWLRGLTPVPSELSAAGPSKGTKRKYVEEERMGEGEKEDDAKKE